MKSNSTAKHFLKLLLIFQLAITPKLFSQNIAINTTGNTPDTSAMLDISSTSQGFLMPRMTTAQMNVITLPATGLLIFNTSLNVFEVNLGTTTSPNWVPIGTSQTGWATNGNAGTNSGANFLGTTDNHAIRLKVNNQSAGFIDSSTLFSVANGNVFYGLQAGYSNPNALTSNTFIGSAAGAATNPTSSTSPADGYRNVAVGTQSMLSNTTGQLNVAIGYQSLNSNTTGLANTAIGTTAMASGTSSNNTAIGWSALSSSTGGSNTAVGYGALAGTTLSGGSGGSVTGNSNIAIGLKVMRATTSGNNNVALGYQSMLYNTTGSNNAVLGYNALRGGNSTTAFTGSNNVAIGPNAGGAIVTGSNNTFIGNNANASSDVSNATAIGNNATVNASNALVLGGTGANAVNVGIGTATPAHQLHVVGQVQIDTLTSGSSTDSIVTVTASGNPGGVLHKVTAASFIKNTAWSLIGNSGTTAGTNFIGTSDNTDLVFKRNNSQSGLIANTNTSFGYGALNPASTGASNVAMGTAALSANTTGVNNTAIGGYAGQNNTTGINNTAVGSQAFQLNTTGMDNTATGSQALYTNTTGVNNVATGFQALYTNTTGNNNTANGVQSLFNNTTGIYNTATGSYSLYSNTTGSNNLANGYRSLYLNTTGYNNTATGVQALQANTTGYQNSAFGLQALSSNTTGATNNAIGTTALNSNTTGSNNIADGFQSLYNNTTGSSNTASGVQTLLANSTGTGNAVTGYQAMWSNTTGNNNTANGFQSLFYNTTGTNNVAIGEQANLVGTTGSNNTALGGSAAASLTTGSNNTLLGYGADVLTNSLINATAIGANAKVGASNSLVLGGTGTNAVNVGIGTATPAHQLHIVGQAEIDTLTSGSSTDSVVTVTAGGNSGGLLHKVTAASLINNTAWGLKGNSGTTAGTNFIGTTDNTDVVFKRNNSQSGLITTGSTSFGYGALNAASTGGNNVAMGALALGYNTTGIGNTAIGYYAEYSNTTGFLNTATGTQALYLNTSGTSNTANGYEALYSNTTGYNNSAIGYQSLLSNTTGKGNTANGFSTLYNNTTGAFNTANGYQALATNITGNYNVANGFQALVNNTIGYYNTANGSFSLYTSTAGSNNVADGYNALYSSAAGYGNTAVGNSAGSTNITGSKLTLIGDSADVSTTTLTNATAIGAYAKVAASNSLVLGGTGANVVKVGIGTTTPAHQLHVVGQVEIDTLFTGLSTDSIVTTNTGVLRKVAAASLTSGAWSLAGNSGTNSNTNFLGTTDNTSLYFRTNNQNWLKVDSVGNVGIGTTSPLNTLHVVAANSPNNRYSLFDAPEGTAGNVVTAFRNISAIATGNQALIGFTNNGTSGFGANWGIGSVRTGNSNIYGYQEDFIVENSLGGNYIERLRVTNSGNVGIGTSTPSSTLQIAGSVSTAIATTDSSYTLSASDYTVIFTGNATTAPTFTLPDPTTCKGRMYRLMNASSTNAYQDITLSMPVYLSNGNSTTLLSMNNFPTGNSASDPGVANTAIIQSDGTIWWRVGL